MNKTKLLFLFAGPKYRIKNTFGKRFKLLSKNFEGTIFTTPEADCSNLTDFKVKTVPYYSRLKFRNYFIYLWGAFKTAREIKKENIDLVISYDPLLTGITAYLIAKYSHSKFIVEVNGDYTHPAIYHESQFKLLAIFKRIVFKTIIQFIIKKSNGVRLLYKSQIDWIDMSNYKGLIFTAPDYVDTDIFSNIPNKFHERNIILMIGFPLYIKGVDIIINAFKSIEAQFPDWTLRILGWYPNPDKINALIGDSKQIQLTKPVPHQEMNKQIGTAKIIAQPSRTEAMGRALVEAAAAGKARIASNVGGIPTILKDNETGLLFEPENISELACKLKKLMTDENLRIKLGTAARDYAQKYNSPEAYTENCNVFYRKVMDVN